MKVYCENCRFYSSGTLNFLKPQSAVNGSVLELFHRLQFYNEGEICSAPENKKIKDTYKNSITVCLKHPSALNKKNDCPFYEEKYND